MKMKNKHISVWLMTDDFNQLQKDLLDKLVNWTSEWQMKFNASKYYVLRITNKKKHVLHNYIMHNQILENLDQNQNPYLRGWTAKKGSGRRRGGR